MSEPLNRPLYGASFGTAVARFFRNYAGFSGRASRSEYWWVALFIALVYLVLAILIGVLGAVGGNGGEPGPLIIVPTVLYVLFGLAIIVPTIALTVRRLHDANLAGWFYLLVLIPGVGGIILFVLALLPSNPAGARFDRAP